jgi:hypothetical protein
VPAHLEMAGQGVAHDAEPDPGDFAHSSPFHHCPAWPPL